jgi:Trm5-related predicted tRNA methylase
MNFHRNEVGLHFVLSTEIYQFGANVHEVKSNCPQRPVFMTAAVFEARHRPRGRTKLRKQNFISTRHRQLA